MNLFDKNYYSTLNYANYNQRERKYYQLAKEMNHLLTQLSLIRPDTKILDYGCAFGYLITAMKRMGYTNIYGYDISEYATEQAKARGCDIVDTPHGEYDVVFILDVLEHMCDDDIKHLFENIQSNVLICRIPCSLEGETDYHLEISRLDKTHINCKDKPTWVKFFNEAGFRHIFFLDMFSIYDSEGVMSFIAFR